MTKDLARVIQKAGMACQCRHHFVWRHFEETLQQYDHRVGVGSFGQNVKKGPESCWANSSADSSEDSRSRRGIPKLDVVRKLKRLGLRRVSQGWSR